MWSAVRTFILREVNTKITCGMAVKTYSLWSCCYWWAQTGVSRNNPSRIRHGVVLMKGRTKISRVIDEGGSDR